MDIPDALARRATEWTSLKRWERREFAQELRKLGLSYREIREVIPASKGSLSLWCRDVRLSSEQMDRLKRLRPSQSVRIEVGNRRRESRLLQVRRLREAGYREAPQLACEPFWTAGVVAYWAEGRKEREVEFTNSDPALVALFLSWARRYLGCVNRDFALQLHLHSDQCEEALKAQWSLVLGMPDSAFRKSFVKPAGTGHRKKILYAGTLRIRIAKSSDTLHRILGWIEFVASNPDALGTLATRAAGATGSAGDS